MKGNVGSEFDIKSDNNSQNDFAINPQPTAEMVQNESKQVQDFLRLEREGISTIAAVAYKPFIDRDEGEKQFFIMWLKMRMPFFADFDKKTLRVIMERFKC